MQGIPVNVIVDGASLIFTAIATIAVIALIFRLPTEDRTNVSIAREMTAYAVNEIREIERKLAEAKTTISHLEKENTALQARLTVLLDKIEQDRFTVEQLRVLAIWPYKDLAVEHERDAIYNAGFEYYALYGTEAIRSRIIEALRIHRSNTIEVGSHGTEKGIYLYNDDLAEPGWWTRIVQQYPVQIVVLLSCASRAVGEAILNAGVRYVVAGMREIEDEAAGQFAIMFYKSLSYGMPVEEAFTDAKLSVPENLAETFILMSHE